MKSQIAKYFWGFNNSALKETEKILKDPDNRKFLERMVTLLSRLDDPKELFTIISKDEFINNWPRIRNYWRKIARMSDFKDWWQTVYEEIAQGRKTKNVRIEKSSAAFLRIGILIKEKRIRNGWTQNELALKLGMKQPDISKIEEGKKNITLETLTSLCKVLDIKNIEL